MMGFGVMMLGGLFSVVLLVIIIGVAIWLIATVARGGSSGVQQWHPSAPAGQAPLDILQVRYAKGEITKEQYEQMKRDLDG